MPSFSLKFVSSLEIFAEVYNCLCFSHAFSLLEKVPNTKLSSQKVLFLIRWTEEIFTMKEVQNTVLCTFFIKDLN